LNQVDEDNSRDFAIREPAAPKAMTASAQTSRAIELFLLGCLLLCAGATGFAGQAQSPQQHPTLELNRTITKEIKGGESHFYRIRIETAMLVSVMVMQQGVDLSVLALSEKGSRLSQSDDAFGRVGPQALLFVTPNAGDYLIRVFAKRVEVGGKYEITLLGIRPATNEDRKRVVADNHIIAGRELSRHPSLDQNRAALTEYEKARALYRSINDVVGQATALQYSGRVYEVQSNYRKALELYAAGLPLWRQAKHRRGEAIALNSIGGMQVFLGELDPALAVLQQSREIHRETGNKEGEALAYHQIANIQMQKGDVPKALDHFRRALNLYREVGTVGLSAYLLSNMGEAYRSVGDFKAALDYQNQALRIWREQDQRHGIATGTLYLGVIYSELGEMRRAISYYEEAAPLCAASEEKDCEARAYNFLGAAHATLGEVQTALDYYQKAAAIYRQRGQILSVIRMLDSAGMLYASLGEANRAQDFFNEALRLARNAQSRTDEAAALMNLAALYQDGANGDRARIFYEQALAINQQIGNRLGEAAALTQLGLLANATRQTSEAIRMFERALAINRDLHSKPGEAITLLNVGLAKDQAGDKDAALENFRHALNLFSELGNKGGEATTLYRIASVQKKLDHIDDARDHVVRALAITETIRGKLASTDLRASYFATVQQYYDLYIELLMRQHRARPGRGFDVLALQASEQARARSLLDLLQESKPDLRRGVDQKLLVRERELEELINGKRAQQERAFSDPKKSDLAKALGQELSVLALEYETLQARIRESNPRSAELLNAQPLSLIEMQRLLDPETILLEYRLGEERSYLWAVSQTKIESYELPRRLELEHDARRLYELITERNREPRNETLLHRQSRIQTADDAIQKSSQRLGMTLLGQVTSSFQQRRWVIIADGALQYVPFAALTETASVAFSSDGAVLTKEIVSLPSIGVLAQLRRERVNEQARTKSVAIFADPVLEADDPRLPEAVRKRSRKWESALTQSQLDFGFAAKGLPRLIASREEAQAIISLAPAGSSYAAMDFAANREGVADEALGQYRVLHFATHALLNTKHPQLSGIVLSLYDGKGRPADGFLRLTQIFNLRLSNDLVVLSACSTALGQDVKGEGLIGLTRGFMYAGVPRVMASLWKVDDEATAELMKIFYRNLLRKQMPAASALTAAQIEMRRQARWRRPYYWGAFTLQGDWR
jgi:CHAT domain-containing protein/tetratricopeptide (TPR) repeat protein